MLLHRIFNSYAKASKRGLKLMPLTQYKMCMRDLGIIPHIASEYKCTLLFKYFDLSKK